MTARSESPTDSSIIADAILEAAEAAGIGVSVSVHEGTAVRNLYLSEAAVEILGWPREVLLERDALSNIDPEHVPAMLDRIERVKRGEPFPPSFEIAVVQQSGRKVPVRTSISRLTRDGHRMTVAFFEDISERQAAELAIKRSEQHLRRVIDGAPDGIVISREGKILYANPAAAAMLGFDSKDALVGRSFVEFLEEHDLVDMRKRVEHTMATGKALPPREYRARRADGTYVIAEITSLGVQHDGGPAVLGFARDVTERKRLHAELARADRLAALGTLAAGVAHEINNPLTFMTLGIASLERTLPTVVDEERVQDVLGRLREIRRGADRVAEIVRDLGVFSRSDDDRAESVDLVEVLNAATRLLAHELRLRGRLTMNLEHLPAVNANPGRLEQVFVNLLLNAAQALPDGESGNEIVVTGSVEPDGRVRVEVRDNGIGIPPDVLSRVFDPFFTTKPVGVGTGLGLAISHRIVSQLGGEIAIDSVPGKGTTVYVVLPNAIAASDTRTTEEGAAAGEKTGRARVLVVDDEPSVGLTLQWALEEDFEVRSVTSGADAIAIVESGERFDAIVCDLLMPRVTGVDVYERLASIAPGLERRLVFMTGGAFTPRTKTFLAEVPNLCVEKPFALTAIREAIRTVAGVA